ncbi:MAG: hypothetical protein JW913_17590 [Chitinispirillaceae bacterium]|nr:hypothetical protein [Chitinispirillaceae bacterium]
MQGYSVINLSFVCLILLISQLPSAQNIIESATPPSVIFELLALNRDLPTLKKAKYLSPTDLAPSPDGRLLYVAEQTAKRIDVIDVATQTVVARIRLPNEVTGCAPSPDGAILYTTCSSDLWPEGFVAVVDITAGMVIGRIPAGHGARAPVITPDGGKLYVCNRFDNDVSVIDCAAQRTIARIPAVREPCCAAVTPDGKTLVVGSLLPAERSTDTLTIASIVSLIDVVSDVVATEIRLPRGSHSVQGVAVSSDGHYAFATHLIGRFNQVGTTVEKGWLHTNNLAIIDVAGRRLINDICLDLEKTGMGNPWSVRCSNDGKRLCVAHAGCDELSVIDYRMMMDTVLSKSAAGIDLQRDFTPLLRSRLRVSAGTEGPRALAVIDEKAYVAGYFSESMPQVNVCDLSSPEITVTGRIPLDQPQPRTGERQGEVNFYDAKLCFQHWQSCHSCHPFHRADGLNWILGGGAVVAPLNTKSIVYAWWTPPRSWYAAHGHAQQAIVAGIELQLFRIPSREIAASIDTLAMYMKGVSSPKLIKGRLTEAAQHGRELYNDREKTNCVKCHPAQLFTGMMVWNAGVPDPFDVRVLWDTPSLVEAWRTAPYNHLGSMTMREMIELPTMSNASANLSTQEINDLMEYVLSL